MVHEYDVFLSYAHTDAREPATAIARRLEASGLRVWSDASLAPGKPISSALEQAMAESRMIIILLSPAAAESQWMSREVAYALRRQVSMIPVVLDRRALDSPLGSLLGDRTFIDVSGMPTDIIAREVLAALNKYGLVAPSRKRSKAAPLRFFAMAAVALLFSALLTVYLARSPDPDYASARERLAMSIRAGQTNQNLRGADLTGTDLSGVDLKGVDLSDANLSAVNLRGAVMSAGVFNGARLTEAQMSGVVARSATFVGANLLAADLHFADLRNVDLSYADMRIADLRGTVLLGAKLKDTNLKGAIFDKATQWPEDFDAQQNGATCPDCNTGNER